MRTTLAAVGDAAATDGIRRMLTVCMLTACMLTVCMLTVCVLTVCMLTVCMLTVCMPTVCMLTVCMLTSQSSDASPKMPRDERKCGRIVSA